MEISKTDTAILITDPQNDFLSEDGVTWGLVGNSVTENGTVENLERVLRAAKDGGYEVVISPHYYYPTDHGWQFGGTVDGSRLDRAHRRYEQRQLHDHARRRVERDDHQRSEVERSAL